MSEWLHPDELRICSSSDFLSYLRLIRTLKDSTAVIAVCDNVGSWLDTTIQEALEALGLTQSLKAKWEVGYVAVINRGKVVFEARAGFSQAAFYSGNVEGHTITVTSKPWRAGNEASIAIDGIDYAVNSRGINVVLFSHRLSRVFDSVAFDTMLKSLPCKREDDYLPGILHIQKQLDLLNRCHLNEQPRYKPTRTWNVNDAKTYARVQRLKPARILSAYKGKTRVHIFWWGGIYFWNAIESLCSAFANDPSYVVDVVCMHAADHDRKASLAREAGASRVVFVKEYDIANEKPDIAILTSIDHGKMDAVYTSSFLDLVRDSSSFVVILPMNVIINYYPDTRRFAQNAIERYLEHGADLVLFDKLLYDDISSAHLLKEQYRLTGNPKFDRIYSQLSVSKMDLPQGWEKLRGKRVVLWTTDHNWKSNEIAFDLYAAEVLRYFASYPDLGLILRPHPQYFRELISMGVWTDEDYVALKSSFDDSFNMVLDETSDYSLAFDIADAIITDYNCGILITALSTHKPIGVMKRYDSNVRTRYSNVIAYYKLIDSIESCYEFLDNTAAGIDATRHLRDEAFERFIYRFDGKNGERAKAEIESSYIDEQRGNA